MATPESPKEFDQLLALVKSKRGFDFSGYKRTSLMRRFRKRMQTIGVESYSDYGDLLEREPAELDQLFDTVLINVTDFFRDEMPWAFLAEEIIPKLLAAKAPGTPIRVWSAGCATGQEAFTLAMLLAEALGPREFVQRVKIYATDLDESALVYARQASYTAAQVQAVPEALLSRYFEGDGAKFIFKKDIRRVVIFGRNDLVLNAPISRIDILACRNTLMYFDSPTQAKIVSRFHFALNDGGYLLVGKAETLALHSGLFVPVDLHRRIFGKVVRNRKVERLPASARLNAESDPAAMERGTLCDSAFEKSGIAQFAVNREGQLVLANERARSLFRLAPTDIERSFFELEVSYRPIELRSLIEQVQADERVIRLVEMPWLLVGEDRWFDVNLTPLYDSRRVLAGVAVSFHDVTGARNLKIELQRAHAELESAYEELQSTNEELETTNEELQSTVEELETTNEELQSTNEEMETMNEELQSTNEELNAVNAQLRDSTVGLTEANIDLESIFASLRGGVVIVDRDMKVRIWNRGATDLWGVRSDEAVDRDFLDLDIGLPVEELKPLIRESMADGDRPHEMTLPAINRRGRKILCRVTSSPLKRAELPLAQGAILVMEEVTE